jgi:hypothetical protein
MRALFMIFMLSFLVAPALSLAQERRSSEIDNIQKLIGEKTPDFIAKPVIAIAEALEKFRTNNAEKSEGKMYHFVFANVFIFYGIFVVILFLLLRTIWRIIF